MSLYAVFGTQFVFIVLTFTFDRRAARAVFEDDFEKARKLSQHAIITGWIPFGIAIAYWIFG